MRLAISRGWMGLLLVGALIVGALVWFGILDWQDATTELRVQSSRVTGAASSAVQSVTSAGSGGGSAAGGSAVAAAQACRENLRRIETVKRKIAEGRSQTVGPVSQGDILAQLPARPVCPEGGTYTFGPLESLPKCSVSGRGNSDPADDHVLKSW